MKNYNNIKKYKNLWDLLNDSSKKYADQKVLVFKRGLKDYSLSYKDTLLETKKFSSYLNSKFQRGDKLLVFLPPKAEWLEIFFACSLLGLVMVTVDVDMKVESVKEIIKSTKPKGIVYSKLTNIDFEYEFEEKIEIERIVKYISDVEAINTREFVKNIDVDKLFQIIYTSGTTGKPKGVMINQKAFVTNLYNALLIFPLEYKFSTIQTLPFSHIYGQIISIGIFNVGGKLHFLNKLNSVELIKALGKHDIDALALIPQIMIKIKKSVESRFQKFKLGFVLNTLQSITSKIPSYSVRKKFWFFFHKQLGNNLDMIISAGAALPPDIFTWYENTGIKVYKGYGATETGPVITFEDKNNRDPYSVGLPIPYQMLKVEKGEVMTKGDHVTMGYYENPEENQKAFTSDGWYKLGDIGNFKNKKLILTGRKKDMVVLSNGLNVFPAEIEFEFNKEKNIEDVSVFGIDGENGEELFAAFLTKVSDEKLNEIVNKVNRRLDINQQIINYIKWPYEDFPRTHTRKIKVNEVKNILSEIKSNPLEQRENNNINATDLIRIIADVTESSINKIHTQSKLVSDLRLDSLGRADLLARIEQKYKKYIPDKSINSDTTVEDLENIIKSASANPTNFNDNYISKDFSTITKTLRNITLFGFRKIISRKFNIKIQFLTEISEHSPKIIIANHRARIDGALIYSILPKEIRTNTTIMMTDEVFKDAFSRLRKFTINLFSSFFAVSRFDNADKSLELTAEFLNKNKNVLLFPEGERKKDTTIKKGIGRIIKDFNLPVIFIISKGLENFEEEILPDKKTSVTFSVFEKTYPLQITEEEILKDIQKEFKNYS